MIFIPAIRVGSGTPCIEKTGEGTLYSTDFEGVIKNTYGAAAVELGGFQWLLDDTLLGNQTGDIKNGARAARIRDGKIEMQWTAAQGIKTFSFLAARSNFSGDRTGVSPILSVQKSTDSGATWTTVGTVNLAGINALTSYSFSVNEDAPCRMRIIKTGGDVLKRCNVDDLTIVEKRYGCIEIPCEPPPPDCLGRNWNTTWRLEAYDSFTPDAGTIQSWSLKFPNGQVYSSTDTPLNIPEPTGSVSSYITVTGQPTAGIRWRDIKLSVNIQHTYKGDVWLTLTPNTTGHTWTPPDFKPCTNCEVALIHGETGGSADNIIITERSLDTFLHTIPRDNSSSGLPIFDPVSGELLCGPAPTVNNFQFVASNGKFTTRLWSGNNWIANVFTNQPLFQRWASFDRYLRIAVDPREPQNIGSETAGPVRFTFAGQSVVVTPGIDAFVESPYQQSDFDNTIGFGPDRILTPWTIEAMDKTAGEVFIYWFVYVRGYTA
jgi:subtilisin-like proprotein convertase family protein